MNLPHPRLEFPTFILDSADEVIRCLGSRIGAEEASQVRHLTDAGFPPITSINALSVMSGFNPGFIWSMMHKEEKHYRIFSIPKGKGKRQIEAPRVGLKFIQKWISIQLQRKWKTHSSVHGFVSGRSHISAAYTHLGAEWIISVDIDNFFPSINIDNIHRAIDKLNYYDDNSIYIVSQLCAFRGRLSQGSPASPVISNMVLNELDISLGEIALKNGIKYTRYADDLVFSGKGNAKYWLIDEVSRKIECYGLRLSERKTNVSALPNRLKVHGLLVHGEKLRLTKGYRNKMRAYNHLRKNGKIMEDDLNVIDGHINYASQFV